MKGKELKEFRREQGWTQAQLADQLGVKQSKVSEWESSKRPIPLYIIRHIQRMVGAI